MFTKGIDNTLEVYEPTLREIEAISYRFSMVTWYGYLSSDKNPGYARVPSISDIRLGSLPVVRGGNNWWSKLKIVPQLPWMALLIARQIKKFDVIHSRGPSVPALVCIVLSLFFRKKRFWHKYAGNWMQPSPPLMYGVQKKLLLRAPHTRVTINGHWPGQPNHVLSFENPCFTSAEWQFASAIAGTKSFQGHLTVCYAGLIAESKGVVNMMKAFRRCLLLSKRVSRIIIAGSGPSLDVVKTFSQNLDIPVEFPGYLKRDALNEVYTQSHVLLLPSASEGFPKVVAEAASFGCIPVVTDVSSIGQYLIDEENGYLLKNNEVDTIVDTLDKLLTCDKLAQISTNAVAMSAAFTYERFRKRIQELVLS